MGEQEPIQDMEAEAGKESKPGLELMQGKELENVVEAVVDLADRMEKDEPINVEQVLGLDEALGKVKVDFYGEEMTVKQVTEIPDLRNNLISYQKIIEADEGGFVTTIMDSEFMTYLPINIAKILVKRSGSAGMLPVGYVLRISDEVALEISKFNGSINFASLSEMSDRQVELFANHKGGQLNLHSITVSSNGLQLLARHEGDVYLPFDLRDEFSKYRGGKKI